MMKVIPAKNKNIVKLCVFVLLLSSDNRLLSIENLKKQKKKNAWGLDLSSYCKEISPWDGAPVKVIPVKIIDTVKNIYQPFFTLLGKFLVEIGQSCISKIY